LEQLLKTIPASSHIVDMDRLTRVRSDAKALLIRRF
jgi:hypothetical protein